MERLCFMRGRTRLSGGCRHDKVIEIDVPTCKRLGLPCGSRLCRLHYDEAKRTPSVAALYHPRAAIPIHLSHVLHDCCEFSGTWLINTVDATRTFCDHPEYAPPQGEEGGPGAARDHVILHENETPADASASLHTAFQWGVERCCIFFYKHIDDCQERIQEDIQCRVLLQSIWVQQLNVQMCAWENKS
ncbi:hypothetical protein Bbelb_287570 [Branchiostoma belcheri]|nr:hypothetical protein Bbelb_287570 [Branchiostoma belcheri]